MAPNGDGELSTDQDLAEVEAAMERLGREKDECEEKIQSLRSAEDPGQGMYFAQEIFAAQQEKLRLQVEMDLCRAKKNRYLLAREWGQV
jgi:uncharacterized membrane protein